jgi:hypothetical protein
MESAPEISIAFRPLKQRAGANPALHNPITGGQITAPIEPLKQ